MFRFIERRKAEKEMKKKELLHKLVQLGELNELYHLEHEHNVINDEQYITKCKEITEQLDKLEKEVRKLWLINN